MKYQVSTCPAPLTIRNRDIIDATGTAGLQDRFIPLLYRYSGLAGSLYIFVLHVHFARKAAKRTCRIYEVVDPDSFMYL